ncbi:hypothetical protein [Sandarakinorhabdus oryzae]|uniref:hypothetical protein n=1 Tax=Sandarakinorhabdus oryzae TaxID=2675220 RepID=UPI0012E15FD4|nr:hypothetical protein [Sandarakinorhabdus oryzae]
MSLYAKCWLFTTWFLILFFSFPFWISFLEQRFGPTGVLIGGGFWLSHGIFMMLVFRCPNCGLTPFRSSKDFMAWYYPWPRKICGHCGRDHRAVEDRSAR